MCINKDYPEQAWISIILRISMATLFAVATIGKFMIGIGPTVLRFQQTFKSTWLPEFMITPYAYIIAFLEVFVVLWLLSGIKLRLAWVFTAFILISLAFGMIVAGQYETAADNYMYVIMACLGLYVSRYDQCVLGGKK
jgi:uncharacterized membrane protein YphA (DoxX/SURF4 family)